MKYRIVGMVVALMLALLPLSAFAQTGVDNSGFQVVNLGSAEAQVVVTYYNKNGTTNATQEVRIQPNASFTFFGATMAATAGFNGSVVVSSNQPIAAIGNLVGSAGLAGSYGGFNGGSQNVSIPLIARANFGIDTWFNVQNAGSTDATVSIAYTPSVAGNAGVTDTATIAPGAAASFFQKDKADLGTRFVGSAKITSNQPVVATVNQETTTNLLTFDAFTGGSTTIAAPLIAANNFGNLTGFQIQNAGTASASVTLAYSANSVGDGGGFSACPTPTPQTFDLEAGASRTVIQGGGGSAAEGFDLQFANCRYVGSALVTSAQPLVGIVNQVGASAAASAYETFNPSATTATTSAPLILSNNFGIFTGVQVQNTGSASASVTLTYGANTADASQNPSGQGNCPTPAARTRTIAAGASFTFIQLTGDEANGFDTQFNGCRYVGSATISASGGTVAAIVNQASGGTGDTLLTYDTFSQ